MWRCRPRCGLPHMSIATREFLRDYWSGLKKLPELVKHISFSRRSLEQELQEVRGALGIATHRAPPLLLEWRRRPQGCPQPGDTPREREPSEPALRRSCGPRPPPCRRRSCGAACASRSPAWTCCSWGWASSSALASTPLRGRSSTSLGAPRGTSTCVLHLGPPPAPRRLEYPPPFTLLRLLALLLAGLAS